MCPQSPKFTGNIILIPVKYSLLLLLIFPLQLVFAQEISLKKGMVVDGLQINDSISETFAVYLPTTYSNKKAWPVIFVFDPQGRGKTATQLFRLAGQEQGYIIAASNNINSEDSLLNNLKVGTRLMARVFDLFSVDGNKIYTAGLAEGAEVASAIPAIYNNIQGVLAVGDIWLNPDFVNKNNELIFLGLVGVRDFRLYKLEESIKFLNRIGHKASLYKFDAAHEWPNSSVISYALGNFTLQEMAKNLQARDSLLVESLYQFDVELSNGLRRTFQFYKSYEFLDHMEAKYVQFEKRNDLKERKRNLRRDKVFRNQRRDYKRASIKEAELKAQYIYFLNEDMLTANFENVGWWSQQITELKTIQLGENSAEAEMAFRLEGFLKSLARTSFKELSAAGAHIDILIFAAILQTVFDKENPAGYKSIISLSAGDGNYDTAMLYLEDLLKTGYKKMDALYNIPGTMDLKFSPEYNSLIKKYLRESRFYNN